MLITIVIAIVYCLFIAIIWWTVWIPI